MRQHNFSMPHKKTLALCEIIAHIDCMEQRATRYTRRQKMKATDFSAYHVATWKDGAMPKAKPGNTVVHYDATSHAYDIADDDYSDFIEWVAQNWEIDRAPRGIWDDEACDTLDEAASDYLERIDVSVSKA